MKLCHSNVEKCPSLTAWALKFVVAQPQLSSVPRLRMGFCSRPVQASLGCASSSVTALNSAENLKGRGHPQITIPSFDTLASGSLASHSYHQPTKAMALSGRQTLGIAIGVFLGVVFFILLSALTWHLVRRHCVRIQPTSPTDGSAAAQEGHI